MFMASVLLMLMLSLRPRLLLIPTFCMEDMEAISDMLDMEDMVFMVLDIAAMFMASVLLMLSLRPRLPLIPIFSMEDMEAILDMLDIEDMPDTHMVDMPTSDKLTGPQHQNGQCNHPCFSISDHNISGLDTFMVTDSRKQ